MAHAVAAHLLHGDFDAALFADDALVLHALVLAAQAFIVLHRPEDAGAEQAVTLRLEGAVVDGFRLLDLAVRPAKDLVRAGQRNFDAVEGGDFLHLTEDIHQLLIHTSVLSNETEGMRQFRFVFRSNPLPFAGRQTGVTAFIPATVTSWVRSTVLHSGRASA